MGASFGGGFIPQHMKNRELDRQLQEAKVEIANLDDQLQLLRLRNQLGVMLIEVERNNFGNAQKYSTQFFDQLSQLALQPREPGLQQRLVGFANVRDEITADLAALNPKVAEKLRALFLEFP
jgi:hypothetical protein